MKNDFSRRALLGSLGAAALGGFAKTRGVELGVCGAPDDFVKAEQYGFDYYEPGAAAIAGLSDAAFASLKERMLASKIRCRSFNSLVRGTMRVVGPDADVATVLTYLEPTLERCRQLGARIAVWGSASSRNVPEGFSRDQAWAQIKAYLGRAGEIARAKQMVIAIEPLRKQESNIINTGAEALKLLTEVNHPNVQMIIDYYHLRVEKEDPEIVRTAREHIVHMHFANPTGRRWPRQRDEDPEYDRFFKVVKDVNYQGGISIEGSGKFESDAEASLAFFRDELK